MAYILGDATLQVARKIVSSTPSMQPHSTIHDNACGNGVVTQAIIETQRPRNVHIYATDLGPSMCDAAAKIAFAAGSEWASRVETQAMPSERLNFGDNTFTHSYMNFLVPGVSDPHEVLVEMRRTMKPATGNSPDCCGVGFVTTWAKMAPAEAVLAAHWATRGAYKVRHPMESNIAWQDPRHLRSALEQAGLEVTGMSTCDATLKIADTRQWAHSVWGFLGQPVGPWVREGEERFDSAVTIVQRTLEENELFKSDGLGGGTLTMRANVAMVKKSTG